jgi:hypothetical protein
MTKEEAKQFLKTKAGWSDERIAKYERDDSVQEGYGAPKGDAMKAAAKEFANEARNYIQDAQSDLEVTCVNGRVSIENDSVVVDISFEPDRSGDGYVPVIEEMKINGEDVAWNEGPIWTMPRKSSTIVTKKSSGKGVNEAQDEAMKQYNQQCKERNDIISQNRSLRMTTPRKDWDKVLLKVPDKPTPPMGWQMLTKKGDYIGFHNGDDREEALQSAIDLGYEEKDIVFKKKPRLV